MKRKKTNDIIDNWCIYGSHWAVINLFMLEHDGQTLYQPAIMFFLNDGEPGEERKNITICSDSLFFDKEEAALATVHGIRELFEHISATVSIFNEEHEIIEELDLNEIDDDEEEETPEGMTIH